MKNKTRELPEDRLASLDEWGKRLKIHPAHVKGFFVRWRTVTQYVLIAIFLGLPWIKIGGHQAILLDLPHRQFAIFGLTFWAHDGPMTFYVLGILTVGLAFITTVWGRIWCGWACPQTVFVEGVFRKIETLIEGNHIKRTKLDDTALSTDKIIKKTLKWSLFLGVTLIITHSFLAYFVGASNVLDMIRQSPTENWTSFLVTWSISAMILFDFAWFREQFCIIMCPYGRFQSVLMDDHSMAVVYDSDRGEPRKGSISKGHEGDCVNCYRCVAVCPTRVDIRRGVQMECIACTACVDACDEIMDKLKKPKGLIRYGTEHALNSSDKRTFHLKRARVAIYSLILIVITTAFIVHLSNRQMIHVALLRGKGLPYKVMAAQGDNPAQILNHFKLHIKNQTIENLKMSIDLPPAWAGKDLKVVMQQNPLPLPGGEMTTAHFFVQFDQSLLEEIRSTDIQLQMTTETAHGKQLFEEPLALMGPGR